MQDNWHLYSPIYWLSPDGAPPLDSDERFGAPGFPGRELLPENWPAWMNTASWDSGLRGPAPTPPPVSVPSPPPLPPRLTEAEIASGVATEAIHGPSLAEQAANAPQAQFYYESHHPTWRDSIARYMMGKEDLSRIHREFVEGLTGSTGSGSAGMGLVDLVPFVGTLAVQEAVQHDDPLALGVAAAPGVLAGGAKLVGKVAGPSEQFFEKGRPFNGTEQKLPMDGPSSRTIR